MMIRCSMKKKERILIVDVSLFLSLRCRDARSKKKTRNFPPKKKWLLVPLMHGSHLSIPWFLSLSLSLSPNLFSSLFFLIFVSVSLPPPQPPPHRLLLSIRRHVACKIQKIHYLQSIHRSALDLAESPYWVVR